eukprot:TRINITY_DN19_c0_g1_i1.p2 TRINITY_DN19_c0_g1~~TRINITY_DN19_c0_g1_i1.p2  ORF type:complete len:151 (+),score=51.99 TRINITY_DN19_c0_g1_i1:68-454(+)
MPWRVPRRKCAVSSGVATDLQPLIEERFSLASNGDAAADAQEAGCHNDAAAAVPKAVRAPEAAVDALKAAADAPEAAPPEAAVEAPKVSRRVSDLVKKFDVRGPSEDTSGAAGPYKYDKAGKRVSRAS